MTRKFLFRAARLFCVLGVMMKIFTGLASAQVVTVEGVGNNEESARRDAMRQAVEVAVGTFIDSKTLVEKAQVVSDEIYAKSEGFVRDIQILSSVQSGGVYTVKARIDVDTSPDSALADRLKTVMMLGDPRIAVVVFVRDANGVVYDDATESAINERLLSLGFSHVLDAGTASRLRDDSLLSIMYADDRRHFDIDGSEFGADILVIGKSEQAAERVEFSHYDGRTTQTQFKRGFADMSVKVIKLDTGDLVGAFHVEGTGMDTSERLAQRKAMKDVANRAAEGVEKALRHEGSKTSGGVQFVVRASSEAALDQFVAALRSLSGVQSVHVRERRGTTATVEADSAQKPHTLVGMLKGRGQLGIFVDGMSANRVELTVTE